MTISILWHLLKQNDPRPEWEREGFGTSNGTKPEGSDYWFTSTSIAQGFATLTGVAFSADACRSRQSCPMLQCIARTQDARLTHYAGADDGYCHPHHSHDHRAGRERLCGTEDRQPRHQCLSDRAHSLRGDRLQHHHQGAEVQED